MNVQEARNEATLALKVYAEMPRENAEENSMRERAQEDQRAAGGYLTEKVKESWVLARKEKGKQRM